MNLIEFDGVTVVHQDEILLSEITWSVAKGEHWLVRGASGSGKSLLRSTLMGEFPYQNGHIRFPALPGNSNFEKRKKGCRSISFAQISSIYRKKNHYYQQRYHAYDNEGHTKRN